MSATEIRPPFKFFTDIYGSALEAGYLYIGVENQEPVANPTSVYWDSALTIPAVQPIRTVNGYPSRAGSPGVLYANNSYSILVRDKKGRLVYSAPSITDPVATLRTDLASTTGAALLGWLSPLTGAVIRTASQIFGEFDVSPKWFGALGDGAHDDTAAITYAINSGKSVKFTDGTYYMNTPLTSVFTGLDGRTIRGNGTATKLVYGPLFDTVGQGIQPLLYFKNCANIHIDNMAFKGIEASRAQAWANNERAVEFDCPSTGTYKGNRLTNCTFEDFPSHAVVLTSFDRKNPTTTTEIRLKDVTISGCEFTNCVGGVITYGGGVNNLIVTECNFSNCFMEGVKVDGQYWLSGTKCGGVIISNCNFSDYADVVSPAFTTYACIGIEEFVEDIIVSHCTFQRITGASFDSVIRIRDGQTGGTVDRVLIDSCIFNTPGVSAVSVLSQNVAPATGAIDNITIQNCQFPDVATCVIAGATTGTVSNLNLMNNSVKSCAGFLSATTINGVWLSGNMVQDSSSVLFYASACTNVYLDGNQLYSSHRQAIRILLAAAGNVYLTNNLVKYTTNVMSTNYLVEITCSAANDILLDHNELLSVNGSTSTPAVSITNSGAGTIDYLNNFLSNGYEGVSFVAGTAAYCCGNTFKDISYAAIVCGITTKGFNNLYTGATVPSYNGWAGIYGFASYTALTPH